MRFEVFSVIVDKLQTRDYKLQATDDGWRTDAMGKAQLTDAMGKGTTKLKIGKNLWNKISMCDQQTTITQSYWPTRMGDLT